MIIPRDTYLNKLISRRHNGMIKIVTGLRRCGKSFLLSTIYANWLKEQVLHTENGITIISIYDFLMKENSLEL
ncbi:MAG: AAA family ATPase [Muribaculaceae bacterium]|nr:AAA family ATPase [Bacteroides sp.]MDE6226903.1 AAA family ATPase [Muribaculaceae bacterium]